MNNIKILDCTLRDGGYINDWNFGYNCITNTLKKLNTAHMDIIEVGFLDETVKSDIDRTKFNCTQDMDKIIGSKADYDSKLVAMVMLGKFSIDKIPNQSETQVDGIRVCFKKKVIDEAMEYCRQVAEKGYDLFLQPASVTDYSDEDMINLINKTNELDVKAFYIVDTYGLMQKEDLMRYYYLADNNLKSGVPIGFHSHNNLQLSFSNAQELFNVDAKRDIYIDSSVFGMGRGAGNLCTELVTKYTNDVNNGHYDMIPILEIVDEYINPIFKKYSWGYSVAYYIAAINQCHPDYATYLVNKQTIGVKAINNILKAIPEASKRNYNAGIIKELYIKYQEYEVDDSTDIEKIKDIIGDRKVLLLAPGKSITSHYDEIHKVIDDEKTVCISINFIPDKYDVEAVFVSNIKRFKNIVNFKESTKEQNVIITSNILEENDTDMLFVNYHELIDPEYQEVDNSGIMAIRLMKNLGMKEVYIAGFDGFHTNSRETYYSESMIYSIETEALEAKNKSVKKQIEELSKQIDIKFITPSMYV